MKRVAFTLVELMVVLAIIVLLAAIGFPVVRGAVDQARQTACTANLRTLGISLQMYRADHDDLLPMGACQVGPASAPGAWNWSWHDSLAPYVQGKESAFRCPLVAPRVGYRYSYGANPWRFGFRHTLPDGGSSLFDSVLLAEKATGDWPFYPRDYYDNAGHTYLTARHRGAERLVVLLESGEARAVKPEQLQVTKAGPADLPDR